MEIEKNSIMTLGGDLEQALRQGYRLDMKALFKEAWALTIRGGFGLFFAILAVGCLWILGNQVLLSLWSDATSMQVMLVQGLLLAALLSPLTAALDMLGVQRSVGIRVRAIMIFDYLRHFVALATASLLINLMSGVLGPLFERSGLPDVIGMLPSILIGIAMLFTVPLILERGLTPVQAIWTSMRLFAKAWPQLLVIHAILAVLLVVAMLPVGLGLILMAPYYFIIKGILYREVCGVRVQVAVAGERPADKGSFVA